MAKIFDQMLSKGILKGGGKVRVGFGLLAPDKEVLNSLKRAKELAEIVIIGPPSIGAVSDFEIVIDDEPEERLARMLFDNKVDGIVRGTIDDFKTYGAYQKISGEKQVIDPGLVEDPLGRQFFISPGSNPEGWEKEERLRIAEEIAKLLVRFGVEPKICVLTAERHETYQRKKGSSEEIVAFLNKTYEDAEWIVARLQQAGYASAKNYTIELDVAVKEGCNIIVPVNGMVGNQIFRALFFCGSKILACPRIGLSRCYEDNSRTEKDYYNHIKWLVSWVNSTR